MSTSYYRTYRPQTASELDLDVVRAFFERILSSGQVSHAYLFTGPKGVGKTSAARILAKMVNCERNSALNAKGIMHKAKKDSIKRSALSVQPFFEPCNNCLACVSITEGRNMDVMEIDAASNRGIDDIRDLREKVGLAPASLLRKVYIIDEVHMLTTEAFNALLKTLEEPPEHVLFVLATTELHKVPDTIVSRCMRLHFPQATAVEVARSLQKAVKGESLKIEAGVAEALADGAEGSFREAMKLLEQLALGGKKITLARAQGELGQSGALSSVPLLQKLLARDTGGALGELQRLEQQGVNWQILLRQALETLREELLQQLGVAGEWRRAGKLGAVSISALQLLIERWFKAAREMRDAPIAQLPLELLVAEYCSQSEQKNEQKSPSVILGSEVTPESDSGQARMTSFETSSAPISQVKTDKKRIKEDTQNSKPITKNIQGLVRIEEVQQRWKEVLSAVRPHNHSLEGLLRSTKPIEIVGDTLRIEVFYQFHLDQLKQDRFMRLVEDAIMQVFGGSVHLEYYLGSKAVRKVVEVENISADVEDNDVVKAAEEIFGAE